MMRIKKSLAFIMSLALVLTCLSLPGGGIAASADETEESTETLTYEYEGHTFTYETEEEDDTVVVTITGCEDDASEVTELVMPDTIEGMTVTEIGSKAFYEYTELVSVTFPAELTSIGSSAFSKCQSLESVDLPDTVTSIGNYAFNYCLALESVDFSDTLRTIGSYAFYNCESLTEVLFPDSLTMVYTYAFANCEAITYIRLPASDASILTNNFGQSTNVETIEYAEGCERPYTQDTWETDGCFVATATTLILPSTLTTTSTGEVDTDETATNDYFVDFESLTNIVVSEDNENFASYDGCIYSKDLTELYICAHGKTTIEFPEEVTTILRGAFVDCSVEEVILPDSVTTIEGTEDQTYQRNYGAFRGCTAMETLYVPETVSYIGEHAFAGLTGLTDATVFVDGVKYHFTGEEGTCLTQLEVSDSGSSAETITADVYDLFATSSRNTGNIITTDTTIMSDLETIIIPASTTSIDTDFFDDTTALTEVVVDSANTVYFAENSVLYQNASDGVSGPVLIEYPGALGSVELAEDVSAIGERAFYNCSVVTYFEFPDTVTEVGAQAFYKLRDITVEFGEGLTTIGDEAFYYNMDSKVVLPEGVTSIGTDSFYTIDASCIVYVYPDSYAEEYAAENELTYRYTSVYGTDLDTDEADGGALGRDLYETASDDDSSDSEISDSDTSDSDASGSDSLDSGSTDSDSSDNGSTDSDSSGSSSSDSDSSGSSSSDDSASTDGSGSADGSSTGSADSSTNSNTSSGAAVGTTVTVGNAVYKVTSGTAVTYVKSTKNVSKVTIPATVKINGKSYKVTSVSASAFAKNTKLKTVVIGKNVTTIGKKAFFNCKNLKKITFKGKKVKSIGAKAFKGTAKKAAVKVPKAKKAAYKKLLKKAGLSAKAKVK